MLQVGESRLSRRDAFWSLIKIWQKKLKRM